jgi:DNA polymerase-3 subunit beta
MRTITAVKFSISAGAFLTALDTARAATPSAPSLTAYAGVLIQAHATTVTITGADGDFSIESTTSAQVDEPGSVLLSPAPLLGLLRTVAPTAMMTCSVANDVTIEINGLRPYTLRPIHASFPEISRPDAAELPVALGTLAAALASVRAACGKEIGGVQVLSNDAGVHLRATDSYRLHAASLGTAGFGSFAGVVPLTVLQRIADSNPSHLAIDTHARLLTTKNATTRITTRLLGVPFPPVEPLLASSSLHTATIALTPFRTALQRLQSVAENARVDVSIANGVALLSASNSEVGTGAEEFPCEATGEIAFTAASNFLADALAAHSQSTITLGWNAQNLPVTITSMQPLAVRCLVMPIAN